MKKIIIVACIAITALMARAQDSLYSITVKFSEPDSRTLFLFLQYPGENKSFLDSAHAVNGNFAFKGNIAVPVIAVLYRKKDKGGPLNFMLEPSVITMTGKGDSISALKITGSLINIENAELTAAMAPAVDREKRNAKLYMEARGKKDKQAMDSIDKLDKSVQTEKRITVKAFVKKHPNSLLSANAILENYSYDVEASDVEPLYEGLSVKVKKSVTGKKIKEMIVAYKMTAAGKMLPDISQADTSGITRSLSEFKGKYVLVDFWASWCGPCRAENPDLVKTYGIYHPKGLEIFAVSYDDLNGKAQWKKAILSDGLSWTHVSELKGWQNSTSDKFNIKSIPANILLDKNGKIIAKNISGDELREKLAVLMP